MNEIPELTFSTPEDYTKYVNNNKDSFYRDIFYGIERAFNEKEKDAPVHKVKILEAKSEYEIFYDEKEWIDLLQVVVDYFTSEESDTERNSDLILDAINLKKVIEKKNSKEE